MKNYLLIIILAAAGLSACTPQPQPIRYGEDHCAHCVMTISDQRYGSELVTDKGKVYKFDSVECLAEFYAGSQIDPEAVYTMLVTDFRSSPELVAVDEAFFLRSENLRSPMGMNLTAFSEKIHRDAVLNSFGGELLSWKEVVSLVSDSGSGAVGMP